jgi:hydrogenase maturation protease
LAYELLDAAYEMMILVDVTPRGGAPGTVYLIEPDLEHLEMEDGAAPDAHGMHPAAVLSLLHALGGAPGRVLLIGCEPARVEEEIGLSAPVAQAVEAAVALIRELIQRESWTNLTKAG